MTTVRSAAPALRVAPKASAANSAAAAPAAKPAAIAGDSLQVRKAAPVSAAKPAEAPEKVNPWVRKLAVGVGTVAVAGALGALGGVTGGFGVAIIAEKFLVSEAAHIVGAGLWGALIVGGGGLVGGGLLGNKWMNKLFGDK